MFTIDVSSDSLLPSPMKMELRNKTQSFYVFVFFFLYIASSIITKNCLIV